MKKSTRIVRSRAKRFQRSAGHGGQKGLTAAGLFSLFLTGILFFGVAFYLRVTAGLPSHREIQVLLNPQDGELLQPTRILDRTGTEVLWSFQHSALEARVYSELDLQGDQLESDIPTEMVKAVLAAADIDFLNRSARPLQGWFGPASESLAERLTADLLLWDERDHPYYSIRLRLLSAQLIAQYGRDQVLEWYLNSQEFGNQIYGVGSAARLYFNKPVSELSLAEAALLAAVGETPTLNPWNSPAAARENQLQLLDTMEDAGLISPRERRAAAREELAYDYPEALDQRSRPVYADMIQKQVASVIPRERLLRGGLVIRSTLDADLQRQLECAAAYEIARAEGQAAGLAPDCAAARLLPVQAPVVLAGEQRLAVQAVMLDSQQGELIAAVGLPGDAPESSLASTHPPGTLLTPFIYLSTFAQGSEPASLVWDIPLSGEIYSAEELHPACLQDCEFHGPVSTRAALINDYLSPAVELWNSQRPSRVEGMISQVGIDLDTDLCGQCEFFPGIHEISLLEIAHGFSVFSNLGALYGVEAEGEAQDLDPAAVLEIKDVSGAVWLEKTEPTSRSVLSAGLAYLINHSLSDENNRAYRWQRNLFEIGRPAAVKQGLVEGEKGAWTVGYTPHIVTAVRAQILEEPGAAAQEPAGMEIPRLTAGLWRALTQYASQDVPAAGWEPPGKIVFQDVCYPSGKLPTSHCPEVVREPFIEGNQPVEQDDLFQVLEVNRETGRLATVFTPPEMIEVRTYLKIPDRAGSWAAEQGIELPPESYDSGLEQSSDPGVEIQSPGNFSAVQGNVAVKGRINPENFVSYRMQVGRGLNPTSWQQIGEEKTSPPPSNRLGVWDTTQVEEGLYALQLIVLREGQQVDKSTVLVSVDNTPPEVALKSLSEGDVLPYDPDQAWVFFADAADNAEMDRVEFFLNSRLVAARKEAPYLYAWKMGVGKFNLRVVAYDRAGNQTALTANFTVER
jgi:membrane peptidoglycan carboxypeptidase